MMIVASMNRSQASEPSTELRRFCTSRLRLPRRTLALGFLLLMQTTYFLLFLERPLSITGDNLRYEVSGWRLAQGRGLSMPFNLTPDETVRGWVCGRHPEACTEPDGSYPTALYPPGYSLLVAAVYAVAGRSLFALVATQLVLLLGLFVLFENVAARLLRPAGYWFAIGIACTYPFLARQATIVMSDELHAVLLFAALATLYILRPGIWRAALFGSLLAAATLTRPYSMFVVPVLLLGGVTWRSLGGDRREPWIAVAAAALPFALWIARNEYWYGRFIPFTTVGLSQFYTLVLEHDIGTIYDAAHKILYDARLAQWGDFTTIAGGTKMQSATIEWVRGHPVAFIGLLVMHVPKVWISLGEAGKALSPLALPVATYLGGLLAMGLAGMWICRRAPQWWPIILTILVYWCLVIVSPEARRTLPLRLPMLLLAGAAVDHWTRQARFQWTSQPLDISRDR